jgi:hypothetical protein
VQIGVHPNSVTEVSLLSPDSTTGVAYRCKLGTVCLSESSKLFDLVGVTVRAHSIPGKVAGNVLGLNEFGITESTGHESPLALVIGPDKQVSASVTGP